MPTSVFSRFGQKRRPLLILLMISIMLVGGAWYIFERSTVRPPIFPANAGQDAIAYRVSERHPGSQIYVMRADGSFPTRLTYNINHKPFWWPFPYAVEQLVINQQPRPAPSGHGVLYLSNFDGIDAWYTQALDGTAPVRLQSYKGYPITLEAAPDGQSFAVVIQGELRIRLLDGTQERCLTCGMQLYVADPSWSPDSTQLVFSGQHDNQTDLYRITVTGEHLVRITSFQDGVHDHPAWSPDGHLIAFRYITELGKSNIYTMRPDGSMRTQITMSDVDQYPVWASNSQQLAFVSTRNGPYSEIFVMNRDGTNQHQVSSGPGNKYEPAWVR